MINVSDITQCRAYGIRLAVEHISMQGTNSLRLKDLKNILNLTENQMYTIRREINKQDEQANGRIKYLHPKDERLVVHIPANENQPRVIMAVEAALLNLDLKDEQRDEIKNSMTIFLKELLNPETKEISHA